MSTSLHAVKVNDVNIAPAKRFARQPGPLSIVDNVNIVCHNLLLPRKIPPRQIFPPRGYHHGNLRAALLDAGLQLIEETGVRALTLRELGKRAGVSRTAAYRHFRSKADLLAALSEAGFEQFASLLERARDAAGPSCTRRLLALAEAYVRFASEHRAYFEVMFDSPDAASTPGASEGTQAARAFQILEETIATCQQGGKIRRGDSKMLARTAWALVHGIAALRLDVPASSEVRNSQHLTRVATQLLLAGLRPRSSQSRSLR